MKKRKITLYYDGSIYTYKWLKGLMSIKKELADLGYIVEWSSVLDYMPLQNILGSEKTEKLALKRAMSKRGDIVMLAFHTTCTHLGRCSEQERMQILKKIKAKCNTLIWLDTSDSTGTCRFDVLPVVDLYFKKQWLKDINLYQKEFYGGRFFCEYYHTLLGIEDEKIVDDKFPALDLKYAHKLRTSWNVALADLYAQARCFYLHPFSLKIPKFIDPLSDEKSLDLQYRGSSFSPLAGYQRQESKRRVMNINYITHSDCMKQIPKNEYTAEGIKAKAILSPFGWGEICGRDFEAITYGATMIKHSMEHLITYPDLYKPNETYVPLKWDFSDFDDVMKKIKSEEYKTIALNAQKAYKFYYSKEGKIDFANHIVHELQR